MPGTKPHKIGRPRKVGLEKAAEGEPAYGPAGLSIEGWHKGMKRVKALIARSEKLSSEHFWSMNETREAACALLSTGLRVVRCGRFPKAGVVVGFDQEWSDVPAVFIRWDGEDQDVRVLIKRIKPEEVSRER